MYRNFDSAYRNHVFTYKRLIKLSQGKGCLGYPRPYNWTLRANFGVLSLGFDVKASIPQGLTGSPNYFGILNKLMTLIICESLREIGENQMACPLVDRLLNLSVRHYFGGSRVLEIRHILTNV